MFLLLFIAAIGGGSVQNSEYDRLEKFIAIEEKGQLESARRNPQDFDPDLLIDLKEFKNSQEFREYIRKHDSKVDRAEAIFIGWLLALLAEISLGLVLLMKALFKRLKSWQLAL